MRLADKPHFIIFIRPDSFLSREMPLSSFTYNGVTACARYYQNDHKLMPGNGIQDGTFIFLFPSKRRADWHEHCI